MVYNNLNNNGNNTFVNEKSSFLMNNAESMSGEEWLRLLEEQNSSSEADENAQHFINCVKNIMNSSRPKWCEVKGAKVLSYDEKNSLATLKFPEVDGTWTNVKNQSIYQDLKPGDNVKVLIQHHGNSADHWIIGVYGNRENPYVKINEKLNNLQSKLNDVEYFIEFNYKDVLNKLNQISQNLDSLVRTLDLDNAKYSDGRYGDYTLIGAINILWEESENRREVAVNN